ncbi:hypothetical protein M8J77_001491 [Diaphorina citri]|nr:hypothetical protein M8J77_001491 [Diaphorina citri]
MKGKKRSTLAAFLPVFVERIGIVNFNQKDQQWKNNVQQVYCYFQHLLLLGFSMAHFLSTSTRSIHCLPELMQCLIEDVWSFGMHFQVCVLVWKRKEFAELMNSIEHSFSKVDRKVVHKDEQMVKTIVRTCFAIVGFTLIFTIVEAFYPLPENEIRYWYNTKRPERKLPYNMKIPFIDETEHWNYKVCFVYQVYIMLIWLMMSSVTLTLVPIMSTYLIGQYTILSKYVEQLGAHHYGSNGQEIFYINIETNEYYEYYNKTEVTQMNENPKINYSHIQCFRRKNSKIEPQPNFESIGTAGTGTSQFSVQNSRGNYQKKYLRQIIKFHQKLVIFQKKMTESLEPYVLIQIFANFIIITLCLQQLVFSTSSLTISKLFKFIGEFFVYIAQCYYWCHCSDLLDDCNTMLCRSITNSQWIKCDRDTKKDICMIIRRTQRSNLLRFNQGAIALNRQHFFKVVKIAYSFVNVMLSERRRE